MRGGGLRKSSVQEMITARPGEMKNPEVGERRRRGRETRTTLHRKEEEEEEEEPS